MRLRQRARAVVESVTGSFVRCGIVLSLSLALTSQVCGPTLYSQAQVGAAKKQRQEIILKVRNAETGQRVWLPSPYVFIGTMDLARLEAARQKMGIRGDAHVRVDRVEPREVRVWIDFLRRDCRYAHWTDADRGFSGRILDSTPVYDLDTILLKGIVAPNFCNSRTEGQEPGVLTIYVVPLSLKDIWNE